MATGRPTEGFAMRYPWSVLCGNSGWRSTVRFRDGTLLNERWHRPRSGSELPRCALCDDELPVGGHAVRQAGEMFHPDCLLYRRPDR